MDTDRLLDPVVKVALEAMNEGDRDLWLGLFDVHAILTDDGNQRDYKQWSLATAARVFIPIWLIAAGVNLWVGVARAGYPIAEEVPFFIVVFAIPAAAAGFLWWRFSRG